MLVNGKALRGADTRFSHNDSSALAFGPLQACGITLGGIGFSGSWSDWCEQGFSICESYLIEAQNLFNEGDLGGFLSMADAQFDPELEDETLTHANALLHGVAFRRLAGQLEVVETSEGTAGLDWQTVANLWRAMETTKGDMRMPRLEETFEKQLRAALRLS